MGGGVLRWGGWLRGGGVGVRRGEQRVVAFSADAEGSGSWRGWGGGKLAVVESIWLDNGVGGGS